MQAVSKRGRRRGWAVAVKCGGSLPRCSYTGDKGHVHVCAVVGQNQSSTTCQAG